jgi:hypothetical protein
VRGFLIPGSLGSKTPLPALGALAYRSALELVLNCLEFISLSKR